MSRRQPMRIIDDANAKRFLGAFERVCSRGHDDREVWSAFVATSASAIAVATRCANEALIGRARSTRSRFAESMDDIGEMLDALIECLEEDSDRDVMGMLYTHLGLPIRANSQFFTPYHISKMIATMILADCGPRIEEKGYLTVADPCCGSGGMLVAAYNAIREQGFNPQSCAWFEAKDVSLDTALMCYVQMSLLGMAGRVVWGDSLLTENRMELVTIGAAAHPAWAMRNLLALTSRKDPA